MMKKLYEHVRLVAAMELQEARKNNGYYFHSAHEGHGVLDEEMDEAHEEASRAAEIFADLMYNIRTGNTDALVCDLVALETHATLAACEFSQVAAMARKLIETIEEEERQCSTTTPAPTVARIWIPASAATAKKRKE